MQTSKMETLQLRQHSIYLQIACGVSKCPKHCLLFSVLFLTSPSTSSHPNIRKSPTDLQSMAVCSGNCGLREGQSQHSPLINPPSTATESDQLSSVQRHPVTSRCGLRLPRQGDGRDATAAFFGAPRRASVSPHPCPAREVAGLVCLERSSSRLRRVHVTSASLLPRLRGVCERIYKGQLKIVT